MAWKLFTLDFESDSFADLAKVGAWRYWEDPTTEIICCCGKLEDWIIEWTPDNAGDEKFYDLQTIARDPEVIFVAHGTQFEKAGWRTHMMKYYGFPDVPNERWIDTMASCAYKNLPLGLDDVSRVLHLKTQKDTEGLKATLASSKIDKKTGMSGPRDVPRSIRYCHTDVAGEIELHGRVGNLTKEERKIWLLDQKINERGIKIDLNFVRASQAIVSRVSVPLIAEFASLTGLSKLKSPKFKDWLHAGGLPIPNLQGDTLDEWLDGDLKDFVWDGVSDDVKRAVRIRQWLAGAAVKKLGAMEGMACGDGRARGLLQYHGAGPGRWAGRLLQPQNFPRGTVKANVEDKVDAILGGDLDYLSLFGEPIDVVTSSLRHALVADSGCLFGAGDFSGIEARIVLALAGQYDKVQMMANGADVYSDMATDIFKLPKFDVNNKVLVDRFKKEFQEERQIGKNTFLGCGFRLGAEGFHKKYCQGKHPLEFAERVIKYYREDFAPEVVKLWYGLEHAARETVWTGNPHSAYGVDYYFEGEWLVGRRPSGGKQYYYSPEKCRQEMKWSTPEKPDVRAAWRYWAKKMGKWQPVYMHGGVLTENVVQGMARDLMCGAMLKCEDAGLPIVLTVHDEILVEAPEKFLDMKLLQRIMEDTPAWAKQLKVPVAVECWDEPGRRYKK